MKKIEPHSSNSYERTDSERSAYLKCIKGLASENPSVVKVLTSSNNYWNLQRSTFILVLHNYDYEYSPSNKENLPLPIQILFCKRLKLFAEYFIPISECTLNLEYFEKIEPYSSNNPEFIDSERRSYLNA